ncbi:DUF4097 family beta strand repeat-containing protein [Actinoplanes oblitus]|uniref:DUF4097 family beta strand repeat-containing protein n=1 Tax=Actinoplanes oblitus TaxID=3040509 RepID=A0ABY8WPG9_9ACTN|nr:DUF4097 family beta strand repeat-containing protein [Actinoplanes oblitus]WIM99745.1 DUF4097 family beta strand repeat-containing protein [Actinoplanes oblitus]
MPEFDTPLSIDVTIELGVGNVAVVASDRVDTVVRVEPADRTDESDVQAAEQVRVDYADGQLTITGPKRIFDFSRKTRAVDVLLELPADSRINAHMWMGDVRTSGRLGACRFKTTGNVRLERTGPLRLHTGAGHITAGRIGGDAEISTGTGTVQVGTVDGAVEVKNSNGDTTIDVAGGDVRVRNANGAIAIDRAGAGIDAKTSNGAIRLGEVVRGQIQVGTATGDMEIGIATGTAAYLELTTGYGRVHNELDTAAQPASTDTTVEVRGRTSYGDIVIRRS